MNGYKTSLVPVVMVSMVREREEGRKKKEVSKEKEVVSKRHTAAASPTLEKCFRGSGLFKIMRLSATEQRSNMLYLYLLLFGREYANVTHSQSLVYSLRTASHHWY